MATVLITGAGRGLGYEFARQYAADGWSVLATCRNPVAAAMLEDLDGNIEVFDLDVTRTEQIAALGQAVAERPIDILINNAGIMPAEGPGLAAAADAAMHEAMAVNAFAPLRLTEALAGNVAASNLKRIVAISSNMASIGDNSVGGDFAYRASKAALNALMRNVAIELAPRGITTIMVNPGWARTDMGGRGAPLAVADSVTAVRALIDRLSADMNGRFYNHDGTEIGW
jgi:NAD(P)-dependent dehydrogenase (short-subunit alcohol dehydrogenase family)